MSITAPHTWVLFILIIYTEIMTTEALITCEAGTFVAGEAASITCKFRTNITASQRALNMALYPPHAPKGAIGKDILLCRWAAEQQSHECHLEESTYTFDHVLTDRLTVRLPAVSYDQAGLYMCFFVPSDGTETHPCELTVVEGQGETDTGGTQEEPNLLLIILPCVGALVVIVCLIGCVICFCRRRKPRTGDDETSVPMLPLQSKTIEEYLQPFRLTKTTLQDVVNIMMSEMKKGLDGSTRLEADIKMFPTFLTHLPNGSESGSGLVLDFNGKQLQVSLIQLDGQAVRVRRQKQYEMPADNKKLFYSMADCTDKLIKEFFISCKMLPLVFLVAFPCKNEALDTACQTGKVLVNQALCSLLNEALAERRKEKSFTPSKYDDLNKVKIVAVVNDAAGTLMSVAHTNCRVALTVGSGFSACFVENLTHPETDNPEADKPLEMIINTELGALGENGCLEFCRTEFDTELDEQSDSPGTQILEKMVSGRYIGELVRLVLEGLTRKSVLFCKVPLTCALFQRSSLSTDDIITIEDDKEVPHQETREVQYKPDREEAYQKTREVLDRLGVKNFTDHDVETVRLVCRYVCERAAFLSAAGLATLINHVDLREVTVVVDGYFYQKHPRFRELMYSKTLELVKPGLKFCLESPCHPRCVGAARIAVASLRQYDPNTAKGEQPPQDPSKEHPHKPTKEHLQKPSEEQSQKPSEEQSQKPSEEKSQKPSEEQSQKPSEEQSQKPLEEQSQKPLEEQLQDPSKEQSQKPSKE